MNKEMKFTTSDKTTVLHQVSQWMQKLRHPIGEHLFKPAEVGEKLKGTTKGWWYEQGKVQVIAIATQLTDGTTQVQATASY